MKTCWYLLLLPGLPMGCNAGSTVRTVTLPASAASAHDTARPAARYRAFAVQQACFLKECQANHSPHLDEGPFAEATELSVDALVQQVLARNPSLAHMTAAWQAASARYPQVTSLDDPMFGVTIGPASFGSNMVNPAYRLEISQRYPWPGKLGLRGQNAVAEAAAAGNEVDDMRLQLIESAKNAFYDYYLVHRASDVNREGLELLQRFKKNAEDRYKAGTGSIADVHQADVEIGRQRERGLLLERMRQVAVARINTLMHFPPDSALPPPPKEITLAEPLLAVQVLRASAFVQRPDLQALANRIAAEEASLALAQKEYLPDFEPFVMYDRFMGNNAESEDLAAMVGIKMNLPVRRDRRSGAVAEAQARIAQRRAELERQVDQVNFQVQEAYAQVVESEKVERLYRDAILPDALKNEEAAQREYVAGKVPFLTLIEAQRNRVNLRDRYHEAVADYYRWRATLERMTGGPLPPLP